MNGHEQRMALRDAFEQWQREMLVTAPLSTIVEVRGSPVVYQVIAVAGRAIDDVMMTAMMTARMTAGIDILLSLAGSVPTLPFVVDCALPDDKVVLVLRSGERVDFAPPPRMESHA